MSEFKQYRRTAIAEMRPYVDGESMADISVGDSVFPIVGDMIARDPKDHTDQWLVKEGYFADNFAEMEEAD